MMKEMLEQMHLDNILRLYKKTKVATFDII